MNLSVVSRLVIRLAREFLGIGDHRLVCAQCGERIDADQELYCYSGLSFHEACVGYRK